MSIAFYLLALVDVTLIARSVNLIIHTQQTDAILGRVVAVSHPWRHSVLSPCPNNGAKVYMNQYKARGLFAISIHFIVHVCHLHFHNKNIDIKFSVHEAFLE
jgi:hypothetical protein